MENICLFMPEVKDYLSIQILNYVLENNMRLFEKEVRETVCKLYIVKDGMGTLTAMDKNFTLQKGDVFITFPSFKFSITDTNGLSLMYISFMGRKGNMMMDKLKVSSNNFLFTGFENLIDFWIEGFNIKGETSEWIAESILLYTFSHVAQKNALQQTKDDLSEIIKNCKKYIDDNFYDPYLSLKTLSDSFFYNLKYISSEFKKKVGVGVNDYISRIRIQHATSLFDSGIKSVNEVSINCGFIDTHYFSKVFKKITGYTPTDYKRKKS